MFGSSVCTWNARRTFKLGVPGRRGSDTLVRVSCEIDLVVRLEAPEMIDLCAWCVMDVRLLAAEGID